MVMTDNHLERTKQIYQANILNAVHIPLVITETVTSLMTDIFWAFVKNVTIILNVGYGRASAVSENEMIMEEI